MKVSFCPRLQAAAEGIVKQMEAKTYSCSECGLKTPSRMTYIQVRHSIKYFSTDILICVSLQHVLNGCIMDMVVGGSEEEGGAQPSAIKKAKVLSSAK